jgi:hypothetical protein
LKHNLLVEAKDFHILPADEANELIDHRFSL